MFEKEAEDNKPPYAYCGLDTKCELWKDGFQKGAKFGYNKANEWHYPSKGELPKEDTAEKETLYLLWGGADDSDYISGVFSHGRFWCFDSGWFEVNEIVAWKEIIPPKEKE